MTMTLLDKARSGRIRALASLETRALSADAKIVPFDQEFAPDQDCVEAGTIRFATSRRPQILDFEQIYAA